MSRDGVPEGEPTYDLAAMIAVEQGHHRNILATQAGFALLMMKERREKAEREKEETDASA
jgi:hypothetical protein